MRHLVSLGRRTIAHIAGPGDQTSALDRIAGYHDVLIDPDPELLREGSFTEESGARAMTELLDRRPGIDGVFVANDLMALGALRVLRERGLRVPQDVAVVGFDDMEAVVRASDPALTTVRQDVEGLGRLSVKLLVKLLSRPTGRVPASVIMPTNLVRRASA